MVNYGTGIAQWQDACASGGMKTPRGCEAARFDEHHNFVVKSR